MARQESAPSIPAMQVAPILVRLRARNGPFAPKLPLLACLSRIDVISRRYRPNLVEPGPHFAELSRSRSQIGRSRHRSGQSGSIVGPKLAGVGRCWQTQLWAISAKILGDVAQFAFRSGGEQIGVVQSSDGIIPHPPNNEKTKCAIVYTRANLEAEGTMGSIDLGANWTQMLNKRTRRNKKHTHTHISAGPKCANRKQQTTIDANKSQDQFLRESAPGGQLTSGSIGRRTPPRKNEKNIMISTGPNTQNNK